MDIHMIEIILFISGIVLILISLFLMKKNNADEKIEHIIDNFLLQIDEDNEEMLKRLRLSSQEKLSIMNDKVLQLEQRLNLLEQNKTQPKSVPLIHSKYEIILQMHQTGKTIDEIAKELNLGHGEIELILDLAKKGFHYA